MYGFKKGAKPKSQHLANGGMVKGAGTGTSDDIKKQVPTGSYIMPADSTQKIGAPSLGALGFNPQKVPVNVSNGEYELLPEQVHAVGVQALEQMKGATHTPVENRSAKGFKPEMFFADGGVVDPEKLKQQDWSGVDTAKAAALGTGAAAYGATKAINGMNIPNVTATGGVPAAQTTIGQVAKGALGTAGDAVKGFNPTGSQFAGSKLAIAKGLGAVGALAETANDGFSTPTEQYRQRFGMETNEPTLLGDIGVRTLGAASDLGNRMTLGLAGKFYRDHPDAAAVSSPTTATTVPNPLAVGATKPAQDFKPQQAASVAAESSGQEAVAPRVNNVIRDGNSFSGSNIGAGFTVNGKAVGGGITNPQANSPQNFAAKNNLFAGTPTLGEGQQANQPTSAGFNSSVYQAAQSNAAQLLNARRQEANQLRENELRMIAPYSGSGGKLTVSQQAARQGLIAGMSAGDLPQYTTDVNNATGLRKQAMGDQAATERTAMQEQGSNYRNDTNNSTDLTKFSATNDLANREFNSKADTLGLQSQQARVMSKALAAYDAAKTPEELKSASERLQQLNGKEQANRFTVVPGGQEYDAQAMAMVNRPGQVLNNQTGEFVNQQASTPPIDRNPAVAKIVNDASLSVDEKRKQLQAMGYK